MIIKFLAPVSGPVVSLENIPDPVFSQKVVGDGIAIDPTDQVLFSPIDGKIIHLHSSNHALTIESSEGIQVLLHIGLDTVNLKGRGFTPRVKMGDSVTRGQKLIEFDADLISQYAKSLVTIMVLIENKNGVLRVSSKDFVAGGVEEIFELDFIDESKTALLKREEFFAGESIYISLPAGLHARPAALLAAQAKKFKSEINLIKKSSNSKANAKSVIAVMSLEIIFADEISVSANGQNAKQIVDELTVFLKHLKEQAPIAQKTASPSPSKDTLCGIAASSGIAVGKVFQIRELVHTVENKVSNPKTEIPRFNRAIAQATAELASLEKQLKTQGQVSQAGIFAAHQELLDDPDLMTATQHYLKLGDDAAFAWQKVISDSSSRLSALKNELLSGRASDLKDVGARVLQILTGTKAKNPNPPPQSILVADSLSPSDIVKIDQSNVVGFVTTTGGATSHVSILARSLGLPAVVGCQISILEIPDGTEISLDGDRGEIRKNITAKEKLEIQNQQNIFIEKKKRALANAKDQAVTKDGLTVMVSANIGGVSDAKSAVEMGCDGVGLLRSEFLFLERSTAPSETEQLEVYQQIADALGSRTLTIRTLDVGADKPLQYLDIPKEENPFLGERGIRIGLRRPELLREQLRAILRVKSKGEIHIMFPLITFVEEFIEAKKIYEEECAGLNLSADHCKVGLMIEVPSAALMSEELSEVADFFSIGTNDLSQYTLAIDRGHKTLSKEVDGLHPSVLKLIELTVKGARKSNVPVAVCGGIAGDAGAIPILIGLGVTELSVSVPAIPLVKAQVREISFLQSQKKSVMSLKLKNAIEVRSMETLECFEVSP